MKNEPSDEFKQMCENNIWHDNSELEKFIEVINELTKPGSGWTWVRNMPCKYIELRFDMRYGGFVLSNDGGRISLEQLQWQYLKQPQGKEKEDG